MQKLVKVVCAFTFLASIGAGFLLGAPRALAHEAVDPLEIQELLEALLSEDDLAEMDFQLIQIHQEQLLEEIRKMKIFRAERSRAVSKAENPTAPVSASASANKALGASMASERYGWTGEQFECLHALIMTESNWKNTAQNPRSSAYGIFQFLDSTWALVGATKTSDPAAQIRAGLDYIKQRYGTPCSAWSYKKSHGFY